MKAVRKIAEFVQTKSMAAVLALTAVTYCIALAIRLQTRWYDLENETKLGEDLFAALYADQGRLRLFLRSMTGRTRASTQELAKKFPWRKYRTVIDIGTAEGALPVELARAHPHLI
jgi:hypothetical protein